MANGLILDRSQRNASVTPRYVSACHREQSGTQICTAPLESEMSEFSEYDDAWRARQFADLEAQLATRLASAATLAAKLAARKVVLPMPTQAEHDAWSAAHPEGGSWADAWGGAPREGFTCWDKAGYPHLDVAALARRARENERAESRAILQANLARQEAYRLAHHHPVRDFFAGLIAFALLVAIGAVVVVGAAIILFPPLLFLL